MIYNHGVHVLSLDDLSRSFFCPEAIVMQYSTQQDLSPIRTVYGTAILCRIVAHAVSAWDKDPGTTCKYQIQLLIQSTYIDVGARLDV
jgi:hypothetical protein